MSGQLRILEGSTFCICDELGDLHGNVEGLFAEDTRFLSLLQADDQRRSGRCCSRPTRSSTSPPRSSCATRSRTGCAQDALSIRRERFIGDGMQDSFAVQNQSMERVEFDLELEFGADFADIFAVKDYDFALGDPLRANPLPTAVRSNTTPERNQFVIVDNGDLPLKTQVIFSRARRGRRLERVYHLALEPRERWDLHVDVFPLPDGEPVAPRFAERRFGEEVGRVRDSLAAWQLRVPQLRATWDELAHAFGQSVSDLASLRMRAGNGGIGKLPGAGVPWFMTVFGRDTIITCLQTLLFGPELARTALEVLADLQAKEDNPSIDAEPGKIVHEVRHGKAARTWFERYYGTVDATPLYLILLSEVWRWTDDAALVARPQGAGARGARLDRRATATATATASSSTSGGPSTGSTNQSWKDSWRLAALPRRDARADADRAVRGAGLRLRREAAHRRARARGRGATASSPTGSTREADELRKRFDEAFWVDDRGGFYALALDGEKRQVDSLCSNIGHLLWSGIVPPERVDAIVDQLMGDELWSGWGVRTMSTADAGVQPALVPQRHRVAARQLAHRLRASRATRAGRRRSASSQRMLTPRSTSTTSCPRSSPACARSETPFPIAYPTAARPQAWAAGTPVLLLQCLLGLQPDRAPPRARVGRAAELPVVGRHDPPVGDPRVRAASGTCGSRTARVRVEER